METIANTNDVYKANAWGNDINVNRMNPWTDWQLWNLHFHKKFKAHVVLHLSTTDKSIQPLCFFFFVFKFILSVSEAITFSDQSDSKWNRPDCFPQINSEWVLFYSSNRPFGTIALPRYMCLQGLFIRSPSVGK